MNVILSSERVGKMPLHLNEEKNRKRDTGVCPKCGERLINFYGVIRCSGSLCDYTADETITADEDKVDHAEWRRMFSKIPFFSLDKEKRRKR